VVISQIMPKKVYKASLSWNTLLLVLTFILIVSLRLLFAFQTQEFSDDSAYFVLDQVESITHTGLPSLDEQGSSFFPPIFYYVLAFFNLFMPIGLVGKIIPNIFASLSVFVVYALSMRFTRNQHASLFATILSAFIPVFFLRTFNSVSIYSFVVPLVLLSFYAFLMISNNDKYIFLYILCIITLSFTHPAVFFVVLGQIIYFSFVKIEGLKYRNVEMEVLLVSVFIVLWSQFLIFKNAFLIHGPSIIWQNTPTQIMAEFFRATSIPEAMILLGVLPAFAGGMTFFKYVRERKSKFIFFFLSYALPIFVFLWFQLIRPVTGLILLSPVLMVVLSRYYYDLTRYIEKTKFSKYKTWIIAGIILVIYSTSISPTFALVKDELEKAPNPDKVVSLQWVNEFSENDSIILSSYEDAFMVEYYAHRTTVLDTNFLLKQNINTVVSDIREFYTTVSLIDAITILDTYDVDYVFVSSEVYDRYGIEKVTVLDNSKCFKEVFAGKDNMNNLYEVQCTLNSEEVN
jgi:hypothetical protein